MKARPFLIALVATVLVLLSMVAGLGWTMARQNPLRLVDQPLELPRAARFVPKQATLSIHWLVDSVRVPAYAQAVAPSRHRRVVRDRAQQIRDGAFALAGLDFESELGDWLGPQVSMALLEPEGPEGSMGWLLVLESRDQDGAKRFLQRFWQARSLAGTDLQISRYRGMGVISGQGALSGRDPQPLATALIDDDLLLLASGREVLEQTLDVSQLSDQQQLGDDELVRVVRQLGDGVAVVIASPAALNSWLGLPEQLSKREDLLGLVAAFQPSGADLALEGVLRFKQPLEDVISVSEIGDGLAQLTASAGGQAEALALINSPSSLLDATDHDPLAQWLGPFLRQQLTKADVSSAATIAGLDDGPLLWLQQPEGWVVGTQQEHPAISMVDDALSEQGFIRSDLPSDQQPLQVWTRLSRQQSSTKGSLEAQLGVALDQEPGLAWWGQTLTALQQRKQTKALQPRLSQLNELNGDSYPLAQQLALGAIPGRGQLQHWRPWRYVQKLAGGSLQPSVQGLAMAVGPDQDENSFSLHMRVRLNLG
ncbi:MAG: DUF3352 domain-containing protein [Prochlorococcus sp.]